MKIKTIITALLLGLVFISCEKENSNGVNCEQIQIDVISNVNRQNEINDDLQTKTFIWVLYNNWVYRKVYSTEKGYWEVKYTTDTQITLEADGYYYDYSVHHFGLIDNIKNEHDSLSLNTNLLNDDYFLYCE